MTETTQDVSQGPGGFAESPPPTSEQLRECVLLLRDLADALIWDDTGDVPFVDEVSERGYAALDRLRPYRTTEATR